MGPCCAPRVAVTTSRGAVVASGTRRQLAQAEGPQSHLDGRGSHPAIHISWNLGFRVVGSQGVRSG
jgi:hypothetical protein